jgi:hypothetical protein
MNSVVVVVEGDDGIADPIGYILGNMISIEKVLR